MLEVSRLNGTTFYLNPDLILSAEAMPDTVITLTTGDKFLVRETPHELIARFIAVKRAMAPGTWAQPPEAACPSGDKD